ncbi:seizure 6-like protein [Orycteropus afer afer]|uniref:Seizure 6-like protein n=1 Tax=Orycteropus afer afer TaxID=1230840 RepID=A0A8B7AJE5_ORYAF|nr:seizure 6-like protein [Orycteropus afer afer]
MHSFAAWSPVSPLSYPDLDLEGEDAGLDGDASPSSTYPLPSKALGSSSLSKNIPKARVTKAPANPAQSGDELPELEWAGTALPTHPDIQALSTLLPEQEGANHTFAPSRKPPSLKQMNTTKKQLGPKVTPTAALQRLESQPASSGLGLFSKEKPNPPGDLDLFISAETSQPSSDVPLWLNRKEGTVPTTPAPLQISPFTSQPYVAHTLPQKPEPEEPSGPEEVHDAPPEEASPLSLMDKGGENELTGSVKSVNLSEGELLSIRGVDGPTLTVLANHTLLVEGQVIRSPTNTISIYFRTFQEDGLGTFQLHYQAFMLSCNFPRRPDFGDVTVMDLHSGGVAHFHCHLGYELQGVKTLTCTNASKPHWSSPEPICSAPCGGAVHNATIGRVLSPSYPGNTNESQFCVWTIEAPEGQKLHLHFERLSLNEKDRMMVYSGRTNKSALLYDSLQTESVPFEGLLSDSNTIRIEFTSDQARAASAFNIRFEAFEKGHCYEPYIQNGNFTTSDPTYNIGTIVEFTCDPGHSLEQGPAIIECINVRDPYWNDTEPLCRAMCGGELSAVAGVVLSPNWPEPYVEGEDCVWKIHVGEEKRIFLDIQLLNLSNSDILTIYDGDEIMPHILGQYLGNSGPQKLYSSTPDLTIQFHSDPAGLIFGKGQGFIMNYIEVSRNDSCSDLPEIQNGWKTTSHTELVRGARITYQCDPGYDIVGSDTLTCQWDLSWSSDPPFCEKSKKSLVFFLLVNQGPYRLLCLVAEAAAETSLEGGNMALAIFIPVLIISLLLGGAYIYITRCRYYSSLRLPLMYSHPYSQITVETEFDNPIYETGETREYEVSI